MSSFNETGVDMEPFKPEVTYGELREIASEVLDAAQKDPSGHNLALEVLSGKGVLVVGMIETLARAITGLVDQLEAAREEQAA